MVIADVSGKGISAALLMAFVRPVMRSALDRSGDPVEALERTNHILVDERRTGLFVTVLAGVLQLDSGTFTFANGGHEPPLLVPDGGTEPSWLLGGGPLLGLFDRLDVRPETVEIARGASLVMYTDGITDAASPSGERFGEARFLAAVGGAGAVLGGGSGRGSGGGASPRAGICRDVIDTVLGFQGGAEPADDLALLVLHRARQIAAKDS